jgi:hypothetical protein
MAQPKRQQQQRQLQGRNRHGGFMLVVVVVHSVLYSSILIYDGSGWDSKNRISSLSIVNFAVSIFGHPLLCIYIILYICLFELISSTAHHQLNSLLLSHMSSSNSY